VSFSFGMFGENLTTEGLLENSLCIGDRLRAGSAVLIVTQPRMSCYKLAGCHYQCIRSHWEWGQILLIPGVLGLAVMSVVGVPFPKANTPGREPLPVPASLG
jgi:hypothetical protein